MSAHTVKTRDAKTLALSEIILNIITTIIIITIIITIIRMQGSYKTCEVKLMLKNRRR